MRVIREVEEIHYMWLGGGNCRQTNDNWRHLNPFYVKKRTRERRGGERKGKKERGKRGGGKGPMEGKKEGSRRGRTRKRRRHEGKMLNL